MNVGELSTCGGQWGQDLSWPDIVSLLEAQASERAPLNRLARLPVIS